MQKKLFFLAFLLLYSTAQAQVSSSCTPPAILLQQYERDIMNLTLRRMFQVHSPDTNRVIVPTVWSDTITGGLAAIYNSGIPQADSVFNRYCVHDDATYPYAWDNMIVFIDTNVAWTHAWRNLNALTGDPYIDNLVNTHGITILQYYEWSIVGNAVILRTARPVNAIALGDSLTSHTGITHAEPNSIAGANGTIRYSCSGGYRYYDFQFEWSDCFDGCDNYRRWKFRVSDNCEVTYLGFTDWGFFGVQPLPAPVNCFMGTGLEPGIPDEKITLYPNPVTDVLHIDAEHPVEQIIISDLSGKTISTVSHQTSANMRGLASGMYLVTVQTTKGSTTRRIIVLP